MHDIPLLYDIARGSAVDGPGLRTVLFFKGCPLRCRWCHNPESHLHSREVAYDPARCIRCGECEKECPAGAIDLELEHIIRREDCTRCGICSEVCDSLALRCIGIPYTVEELREVILRDKAFFETSGGGVTLSGGEPLLYLDYIGRLTRCLKKEGIHIAVQTSGYFDYREFKRKVLPWLDLVYYDVKLIDREEHWRLTGRNNDRILRNLRRLSEEEGVSLIPRVPLVPDCTAEMENLFAIADFLRSLGVSDVRFLTYNPLGAEKWKNLGKNPRPDLPREPLSMEREAESREKFRERILGNPS